LADNIMWLPRCAHVYHQLGCRNEDAMTGTILVRHGLNLCVTQDFVVGMLPFRSRPNSDIHSEIGDALQ